MTPRRLVLAWFAALGLLACNGAGMETGPDCSEGTCDDTSQSDVRDLMPRAPEAPGTISITRNGDQWLAEVIGPHGEIVLLSKSFSSRTSALNGALAIEENGVLPQRYVVSPTGAGFSFALRAGNNSTLADSEVYATDPEATEAAEKARDLIAGIVQYRAAVTDGARFELSRDGSKWKFEMLGDDGQSVLRSQLYSRRHDAVNGIESVRKNGKDQARYQVVDSPPRFVLNAANGEEIAESATSFDTPEAADAAVASTQALLTSERVANPW